MKKKKLIKEALNNPELFDPAELSFFQRWLQERKRKKQKKEQADRGLQGDTPR